MRFFSACLAIAGLFSATLPCAARDLIADSGFDFGQDAFWASGGVTLAHKDGALCAMVAPGGQPWESLVGVNDLKLTPGDAYRLDISADSTVPRNIPVLIQRAQEPFTAQAKFEFQTVRARTNLTFEFPATESEPAQVIFHLGGATKPYTLCFDRVGLTALEIPTDDGPTTPAFVNQAGYFLDGPKRATILSGAREPLPFEILDSAGALVARGRTVPVGFDATAGRNAHIADFSDVALPGNGDRLVVDGRTSTAFAIGVPPYARLRSDALSWFYPQRSGIAIRGDIAGAAYARPAGHIGQAPNQGDTDVGCLTGAVATTLYGDAWSCHYRLDVSGGWYDAGDHGKYVVSGAIAAAQLMGTFERAQAFAKKTSAATGDDLTRIPERGNGVPDLLDEARYELEFLMKMMVPDGEPLAGMVHHKIHDVRWTGLPLLPHLDAEARALHRPSTAATLDLAAVTAQGARLFEAYDGAFSKRLLVASRKAWLAAAANPVLIAPRSDGQQGGGDYEDDDVSDELYWAATELYLTTGKSTYLAVLRSSRHWSGDVFSPGGAFHWRNVAGLARLDLALYAKSLPADDRKAVRNSVLQVARTFLDLQAKEPFGQIYRPRNDQYDWGSNQLILQNMIVLSAAYDLTGETPFLDGVRSGIDYLLGRNALNQSYITGYGSQWSKNQYSKWYAHQVDPALPPPPDGSLAGGPNSALVDDVAKDKLAGCAPQTCYIDDINSWSINEIAINWNAPLVYIASFLADTP